MLVDNFLLEYANDRSGLPLQVCSVHNCRAESITKSDDGPDSGEGEKEGAAPPDVSRSSSSDSGRLKGLLGKRRQERVTVHTGFSLEQKWFRIVRTNGDAYFFGADSTAMVEEWVQAVAAVTPWYRRGIANEMGNDCE